MSNKEFSFPGQEYEYDRPRQNRRRETHNEIVERLVDAALDVLHHDRTEGDEIDKYERHTLRTKFGMILGANQ